MPESSDQSPASFNRSATSVTVDNLIRRALRVSNPNDPGQLAKALLDRFAGDAEQLRRERTGAPVLRALPAPAPVIVEGAGQVELKEAQDDIDRDLDALVYESQLKDIRAELEGWASAIRSAGRNGIAAAHMALSPNERDRAFAARHTLTDYARLSRYLAALTSCVPGLFCRLAQSCDLMGSLVLVRAGEALAAGGVTSTSVILQSPSSELQVRREAVLAALRNLLGSTQEAHAPNEWPRGLTAVRQLYRALEDNGATDLRAYLDEGYLGGVFDEMIALASGRSATGMRALGATSVVTATQLERFLRVAQTIAEPESPQLANFLTAIQYFIEAFGAARSGYRLTFIARPPLLFYGLYGIGGPDLPTERLLDLVIQRGRFAAALDCFCCCACDEPSAEILVIGGKALFDIDRAIDLLAQGSDKLGDGEAELRAAAFGLVVQVASTSIKAIPASQSTTTLTDPLDAIVSNGLLVQSGLFSGNPAEVSRRAEVIHSVLCIQRAAEERWLDLLRSMSAECRHLTLLGGPNDNPPPVVMKLLDDAQDQLPAPFRSGVAPCGDLDISIPDHLEVSLETLVHNIPFKGRNRNRAKKSP